MLMYRLHVVDYCSEASNSRFCLLIPTVWNQRFLYDLTAFITLSSLRQ